MTRPDLLDRSLILNLPEIDDGPRLTEEEFWRSFEAIRPRVLGALLDAVSVALRNLPKVQEQSWPRMADFARWATAAEPAIARKPGAFGRAYARNREAASELALEGSPTATAVLELAGREEWEGTASELLERLNARLLDDHTSRQRGWPQSAHALSNALRRHAPTLRALGVAVTFRRAPGGVRRRLIRIMRTGIESRRNCASQPSRRAREGGTLGTIGTHQ